MKRRTFLKQTARITAVAALGIGAHPVLGANDRIRLGVIGIGSTVKIGGKGRKDIVDFRKIAGVQVAAVCDCDADHLDYEVAQFRKWGEPVKAYRDYRELLADPELDAVSITTPNHWHSLMAIQACQAGKDVFIQKPMSHNVVEGRKVVEAARRHGRIVQATHGPRNSGAVAAGIEWVRAGNLGRVLYIRGLNYRPRRSIGRVKGPQPIPARCDYNLWCGPAPMKPLWRQYLHYDWHWDWDTGNGDLGNMGIHYMDGCRWAAGQNTLPRRVLTVGGRLGYEDDGQTPNTLVTLLDYEPAPVIFEVRGLPKEARYLKTNWERNASQTMDQYLGLRIGVVVHCEGGTLRFGTGGGCAAYDADGRKIRDFTGERPTTKQNFIDCIRSRRTEDLLSPAIEGHLSAGLVHLANISHRLGREAPPATARERARMAHGVLAEALDRMLAHLEANEVDLRRTPLRVGPLLEFDPAAERFHGEQAARANALCSRDYRPPFLLPDKI